MKTDDVKEIGKHVFERAGLGLAPFKVDGIRENMWSPAPGVPAKPGGTCAYCGNGIQWECVIKSADGRTFTVGCDCVQKTGDAGLIRAYKARPEVRAKAKLARKAKADTSRAEVDAAIKSGALAKRWHPLGYTDRATGRPLTMQDWAEWMLRNCGASGITAVARLVRKTLA